MIDNLGVQEKVARNGAEYEEGFCEGYDYGTGPLLRLFTEPVTLKMLTARQKGFIVGYITFLYDRGDHA